MTKSNNYNFYAPQDTKEVTYDKGEILLTKLLWFIIGFCTNFLLLIACFYLPDLLA